MSGISVLIVIIVAIIFIRKFRKDINVSKKTSAAQTRRVDHSSRSARVEKYYQMHPERVNISPPNISPPTAVHPAPTSIVTAEHRTTSSKLARQLEDRNNDWLAKELREERRKAAEISAMFALKQSHADNCDAYAIRQEHYNNCDNRR